MTRRQRRKLVMIGALVLLLALLGVWYMNFRATKKLSVDIFTTQTESAEPPEYLFSFSGAGKQHLLRPVGVLEDGDNVFVADARQGVIFRFNRDGQVRGSFGKGKLQTPLYIAKNPKTGDLYVSDRRLRKVQVFDEAGKFVRTFEPAIPKKYRPPFDTKGDKWVPVAMAFGPDGTFYVTDLLNGHRMLIFKPDGSFYKVVGTFAEVQRPDDRPGDFQFPNSVKVHGDEVWVSDSNNRRIQVFNLEGEVKKIMPVEGLPRGIDFLPPRSKPETGTGDRLVVVDTLAHDATIFSLDGEKVVGFGTQGALEGQFRYPTDIDVGARRRIYVADTSNVRVQVWGWPADVAIIPPLAVPQYWGWCLTPLLLLPLLLLRRKRKFMATADFIEALIADGLVNRMPDKRRKWFVSDEDYQTFTGRVEDGVSFSELLEALEFSDSDARAISRRFEISYEQAAVLARAQHTKVFCTEDAELRHLAKALDLDVANHVEFVDRFASSGRRGGASDE